LVLDSCHHESWMPIVKNYLPSLTFCIKISFHAAKACCCQFRGCVQCVIIREKMYIYALQQILYIEPLKKCPHIYETLYLHAYM
jgi:hypothetical protein